MSKTLLYKEKVIGQIPSSWDKLKIDQDLIDILGGFSCPKNRAVASGLPHLRPFNITTEGEVIYSPDTVHIPNDYQVDVGRYFLLEEDVLFNNTNSVELVGKTGIVRQPMRVAFSNHINRLRVRDRTRVDPKWLALYLKDLQGRGFFAANCNKWIGQAGFSAESLSEVEIPLPDIDIQHQIVSRIEALLTEVREMRKIHQNIISDLNILFDSVLAQTFKEINKKARNTSSLDQITTVTSGGTPSRTNLDYYTGDIPWVKTGELVDGVIDDTEEHISEKAVQESNAKIYPKDTLLIAMYGQGQTRGRTGILRKAAASNQACCAIYPNPNEFDTRYLQYWFQFMYKELRKQSESRGGSQPNLNQTIIKRLVPPLTDVVTQKGYINFLDQVKTQVAEMKAEETSREKLFHQLERSILAKAFEGNF